ncbi:MAG: hypothetical protein WBZ05_14845 [Desulfobacterales bacterium]|jgi:hypothetical protein
MSKLHNLSLHQTRKSLALYRGFRSSVLFIRRAGEFVVMNESKMIEKYM